MPKAAQPKAAQPKAGAFGFAVGGASPAPAFQFPIGGSGVGGGGGGAGAASQFAFAPPRPPTVGTFVFGGGGVGGGGGSALQLGQPDAGAGGAAMVALKPANLTATEAAKVMAGTAKPASFSFSLPKGHDKGGRTMAGAEPSPAPVSAFPAAGGAEAGSPKTAHPPRTNRGRGKGGRRKAARSKPTNRTKTVPLTAQPSPGPNNEATQEAGRRAGAEKAATGFLPPTVAAATAGFRRLRLGLPAAATDDACLAREVARTAIGSALRWTRARERAAKSRRRELGLSAAATDDECLAREAAHEADRRAEAAKTIPLVDTLPPDAGLTPAQLRAAYNAVKSGDQPCAHSFVQLFGGKISCACCWALLASFAPHLIAAEQQKLEQAEREDAAIGDHAEFSHGLAVTVEWLVAFTTAHNCWGWSTWEVQASIIKPATEGGRIRYVDLPHVRAAAGVGPADVFASRAFCLLSVFAFVGCSLCLLSVFAFCVCGCLALNPR
eukprot:SAG22_NODE_761_length_7410_cov_16.687868_5_plen_494_part_00